MKLVASFKERTPPTDDVCEHHVFPRSLFPLWADRKSNLVTVTHGEHVECHRLLNAIYPDTSMVYAYWMLYNKYRIGLTPEDVERLQADFKRKHSLDHSVSMKKYYEDEENRKKTGESSKKFWRETSEERREEIREARRNGQMKPESRKKMSDFQKTQSHPKSAETRAKISASLTGRKQSEETKVKRAASLRGKKNPPSRETVEKRRATMRKRCEDPEFRKKLSTTLGRHWYTNGETNVVRDECPPGFVPGINKRSKI